MSEFCAAIDLGTNTARLLIAKKTSDGIVPIHIERSVVRLGGDFSDEFGLSPEAQERAINCLNRFSTALSEHGVLDVRASATSAVRDAVNGQVFVNKVFTETGINLSVIDGNMEATLTLKGVLAGLDTKPESFILLDVGGGSTEFIISVNGYPAFIKSMPIGVVRLTEGFTSIKKMSERIKVVINQLTEDLRASEIVVSENTEFIGTAGTATTIAAIKLKMSNYDYRRVNNLTVKLGEIDEIFKLLSSLTPNERLKIRGVENGREDLIIAGMLIIIEIMTKFNFKKLKVSDFGLLEGLALSDCVL